MLFKKNNVNELKEITESKTRKKRTNFKPEKVKILNDFFHKNPHPSQDDLVELSKQIAHSEQEIKNWFNNKRQSTKKTDNSTMEF